MAVMLIFRNAKSRHFKDHYREISMKVFTFLSALLLSACASSPSTQNSAKDPIESFNRVVFKFNDGVDRALFKPVAKAYRVVAPDFVEEGISNFFDNIRELPSFINSGLQGKEQKTLVHLARFLMNSSLGILGFFDVAEHMGLEKQDPEDFGQTLGVWGIKSGPYIVIPFLGPSTLRDGSALFTVDLYTYPIGYVDHDRTRHSLTATNIIDIRAGLLDSESLIGGDRYIFIREAYLQRRAFLIRDGQFEDNFGGNLEDEDF